MLKWLPFFLVGIVLMNISIFSYFLFQQDPHLAGADVVTQQTIRSIKAEDQLDWFVNESRLYVNRYQDPKGFFSFEYSPDYEVRSMGGVTYLVNNVTKGVIFHVFPYSNHISFSHDFSQCARLAPTTAYCFQLTAEDAVQNLTFYPEPLESDPDGLKKMSRAEGLALVLRLTEPGTDWGRYAGNCFEDIDRSHELSGEICAAKQKGYVVGIDEKFYPDQSITLLALLKLLYLSHGITDYSFNGKWLDSSLFESMQTIHPSYPHIAKAVYEGIVLNPYQHTYWPNQALNGDETFELIQRFNLWASGHQLKSYHAGTYTNLVEPILLMSDEPVFIWNSRANLNKEGEETDVLVDSGRKRLTGRVVDHLWVELGPLSMRQQSMDWHVWLDWDRKEGWARAKRSDGSVEIAELSLNPEWVRSTLGNGDTEIRKRLTLMGLLPPKLRSVSDQTLPNLSIDLSPDDLESLIHYRGSDRRYPALVTWQYPDGQTYQKPALVKSRGNATRSFIKTNYTIEFFDELTDNDSFNGDEWLKDHNEIKLRGLLNEPSQLREKLYYRLFQAMGQVAPDFFESKLTVNGMPLGLYHVTEPIKDDFFARRHLKVKDYYYAQNSDADTYANLTYFKSDKDTLALYKINGSSERFLRFIDRLRVDDESLMDEIDVQSVFDYALITYLTDAVDSLIHNYYLYFDESTRKWRIAPWDADETFLNVRGFYANDLKRFMKNQTGQYNELIHFVYNHLSTNEFYDQWLVAQERWNTNVDLERWIEQYKDQLTPYLLWDNELWNEVFLGRKEIHMNAMSAIDHLSKTVESIQVLN
ncbi:CotH kinase family protein [Candidatus Peregrinibacteria bacterium]|nr:MAG: CotH kinase family protein [Candidatus Peregrinibacteria bacterium]